MPQRTILACQLLSSVLFFCVGSLFLRGQQISADQPTLAEAQKLATIQMTWGSASMNSAGASLELVEMGRRGNSQVTVNYRLVAKGLSRSKLYDVFTFRIGLNQGFRQIIARRGVSLDDRGVVYCSGKDRACLSNRANGEILFPVGAAKGDPVRFGLVSEDGAEKAFAYTIPFPSRTSNRGCSLEAILLMKNADAVLLRGSGFAPHATIDFDSASEGESTSERLVADGSGNGWILTLPFVPGKSRGSAKVSFTSDSCDPSLSFEWGAGSYRMQ